MPIKTKDGWASNGQIARQEKAWAKARSTMMAKLGDAMDDLAQLNSKSKEIFNEMDTDKNGSIDPSELKEAMRQAGINLTNKEVQEMVSEADADGDNLIDLGEFQALMRAEVRNAWCIADRCRRAATSAKPRGAQFCLCCSATSVLLPLLLCRQLPCAALARSILARRRSVVAAAHRGRWNGTRDGRVAPAASCSDAWPCISHVVHE